MKTIYLIISNDYITIRENINKILTSNHLTEESLINYDLSEIGLDKVIEDLDTYNFLVTRKVIACSSCYFLSNSKPKGILEQDTNQLSKYLDNPSEDNILILITDKVDERKSLVKTLREKASVIEENISIDNVIKNHLEDYQMDNVTTNYLINYCNNDNEKILNELEKLKNYKVCDKIIDRLAIDEVVIKSYSENVFSLIDAIMKRNSKKAISLYNDLIASGEDLNKIVVLLADQFRMIYNGRILLRDHHNDYKEVASILSIHPYRFQKAIESSYSYSNNDILKCLKQLDEMEIKSKTDKTTTAIFEVFIYSL